MESALSSTGQCNAGPHSPCPPPPPAKVLFIIIDGLGDIPLLGHGALTPLEAAHTPTFDALAENGLVGLLDPVRPGLACGSDTAHLSILGCDPTLFYRGRGAFECAGAGLELLPGDIAFKSVFASLARAPTETVSSSCPASLAAPAPVVVRRRCASDFPSWGPPLCAAASKIVLPEFPDVSVEVAYTTEHRCAVRLRSSLGPLSDQITDTDPLVDEKPLRVPQPLPAPPGSSDSSDTVDGDASLCCPQGYRIGSPARSAAIASSLCLRFRALLASHPLTLSRASKGLPTADAILLRGAARAIAGPQLPFPAPAAAVAPTAIVRGVLLALGAKLLPLPVGATGGVESNLRGKMKAASAALGLAARGDCSQDSCSTGTASCDSSEETASAFGFVLVHIKGADHAAHDGSFSEKARVIAKTDAALGDMLLSLASSPSGAAATPLVVAVAGDHTTTVASCDHAADPVPFVAAVVGSELLQALARSRAAEQEVGCVASRGFGERSAAQGALGRFSGSEVMPLLRAMAAAAAESAAAAADRAADTTAKAGDASQAAEKD